MHEFPSDPSVRAQWVQFVRRHRHDYKDPTSKYASLCSAHFDESCYERKMSVVRSVMWAFHRSILSIALLMSCSIPPFRLDI